MTEVVSKRLSTCFKLIMLMWRIDRTSSELDCQFHSVKIKILKGKTIHPLERNQVSFHEVMKSYSGILTYSIVLGTDLQDHFGP